MDLIAARISERALAAGIALLDHLFFMDDMQFVVDDSVQGHALVKIVVATFAEFGLTINLTSDKSAAFVPPSSVLG